MADVACNVDHGDFGHGTGALCAYKRPWWRHWHVEGHDFGYSLREAKMVVDADFRSAPDLGRPAIERCDVDHILEREG